MGGKTSYIKQVALITILAQVWRWTDIQMKPWCSNRPRCSACVQQNLSSGLPVASVKRVSTVLSVLVCFTDGILRSCDKSDDRNCGRYFHQVHKTCEVERNVIPFLNVQVNWVCFKLFSEWALRMSFSKVEALSWWSCKRLQELWRERLAIHWWYWMRSEGERALMMVLLLLTPRWSALSLRSVYFSLFACADHWTKFSTPAPPPPALLASPEPTTPSLLEQDMELRDKVAQVIRLLNDLLFPLQSARNRKFRTRPTRKKPQGLFASWSWVWGVISQEQVLCSWPWWPICTWASTLS